MRPIGNLFLHFNLKFPKMEAGARGASTSAHQMLRKYLTRYFINTLLLRYYLLNLVSVKDRQVRRVRRSIDHGP